MNNYIIDNNSINLLINNKLVSKVNFTIESPDNFFECEYLTLYNLKQIKLIEEEDTLKIY